MRAVDTNILARYYLADDARQSSITRDLLTTGDLFVPKTVVLELEWVLRGVAGQPRAKVLACLTHLAGLPGITLEDRKQIESALAASERGIDFADALHHAASAACEELLTFDDRGYARRATRLKLKPSVKVPGN